MHVLIGDKKNMGSVPWAARDPIFWLHHGNIDRLWASWNKGGRSNPTTSTFLSKTFTFADENGLQVVGKVNDVVSILALGYTYSAFEPVPPCLQTSSTATALTQSARAAVNVLAAAGPVALASEPVQVQLKTSEARTAGPENTFDKQLRKSPLKAGVHLVLSKLRAAAPPNVLYEVYLMPARKAGAKPTARRRVGTINFFNAVNHSEDPQSFDNDERFVSFDVTGLVRRWQLERRMKAEPLVLIEPVEEPALEARPEIGLIELILE